MIEKLEKLLADSKDRTLWKGTQADAEDQLKNLLGNLAPELLAVVRAAMVINGSIYIESNGLIGIDCGDDEPLEFSKALDALASKLKELTPCEDTSIKKLGELS